MIAPLPVLNFGWRLPVLAVTDTAEYAVEAALVVVVLLLAWRMARALRRRTRELQASEARARALFDHASVVMLEEDQTEVMKRLATLRASGVTDIREALVGSRDLTLDLFRRRRFTAANRAALNLLGARDLADLNAKVRAFAPSGPPEAFAEAMAALWERRPTTVCETGMTGADGIRHVGVLQLMVPTTEHGQDFSRVLLTFTDLSALRASEQRYRLLVEHAVEGVFENPIGGGFGEVNPAMARIMGFESPEALRRMTPEETARIYVKPGRREEFFQQLGTRDVVTNFESEIRRPDGTTRWISENVRAVRDEQGRLRYLQGLATDITERKQAEVALRASEDRYRTLFEHSPFGIVEYDYRPTIAWMEGLRREGVTDFSAWCEAHPAELRAAMFKVQIVGANGAALRLIGVATLAEGVAELPRMFTADTVAARRGTLLAIWNGDHDLEGEFTIRSRDGTLRKVLYRWWVPAIDGRESFERTQLALIDLTDVRSAEAALAAERERLSVTLRAMTESVFTVDPAGVVQFINEAAGALTGWPPAGAVGRPIDEVCVLVDDKQGRVVRAPIARALAASGPIDLPAQATLRSRSGQARLVEGRCAPIQGPDGRGLGAVLVLRDVSERARLEAEMQRVSKLQSVGVLAGGIAHDFNNLLAVVMGNLSLALLDEKTAAAGGRWLREAERGAGRARDLTQQLLTFAKGGEPVRASLRLAEVVREAAEFSLHGANVRCEFQLAPDVRPADADKGQIGQAVQNLVLNATQAMPGGGVIRLSLRNDTVAAGSGPPIQPGEYVKLSVADTGHGIAPEHLDRIFEPFYTTKEHGTGLGLATVFSIVRKHGGHVAVESEAGKGTTFHLWLPAARTEPAARPASDSPFGKLEGRVLFMDDEDSIREMTGALLARLGLTPTLTKDGEEALRAYEHARERGEPFDLVIMDLTVPGGMGGAQAMLEILKIDPGARGIVSSGYSSSPVMANHRAHGFRGMIPKPYRMADFVRAVQAVLKEE